MKPTHKIVLQGSGPPFRYLKFLVIFFGGPNIYRTSDVWMFREGNSCFVFVFPIPIDGQDGKMMQFLQQDM